MILPDTSVWIDYLRNGNPLLADLLERREIVCHPFVIGELACGSLKAREVTLEVLQTLDEVPMAQHDEVMQLIELHDLMASGIGWVDAHVLGSTLLAGAQLWTLDKPLARAAAKLSVLWRKK